MGILPVVREHAAPGKRDEIVRSRESDENFTTSAYWQSSYKLLAPICILTITEYRRWDWTKASVRKDSDMPIGIDRQPGVIPTVWVLLHDFSHAVLQ